METVSTIVEQALRGMIEETTKAAVARVVSNEKVVESIGPAIVGRLEATIAEMPKWSFNDAIMFIVKTHIEKTYGDQIRAMVDAEWKRRVEETIPKIFDDQMRRFVEMATASAIEETRKRLYNYSR